MRTVPPICTGKVPSAWSVGGAQNGVICISRAWRREICAAILHLGMIIVTALRR
jgi:hypothetical protein